MKKKPTATVFTNWTNEDFYHAWDGTVYTFKAGESTHLETSLALHFAKHLANREVVKQDKFINHPIFKEYFNRCLGKTDIKAEDKEQLKVKIDNAPKLKTPDKKIKGKKAKKGKDEDNFEGK